MMTKKTLSILIIFGLLFPAFGQEDYLPLLDGERKYVQLFTSCDAGGGTVVLIRGDTLIGNTPYHHLYLSRCDPPVLELAGFVRTNDNNAQLWYTQTGAEEILLMDLDLTIGDNFTYDHPIGVPLEAQVNDIIIVDGRKVVVMNTSLNECVPSGNLDFLFIEGIGPTYGIVPAFEDSYSAIKCVFKDSVSIYENEDVEDWWPTDCDVDCLGMLTGTTIEEEESPVLFRITGNHVSKLQLQVEAEQISINIVSTAGRSISTNQLQRGNQQLDISNLSPGTYWLTGTENRSGRTQVEPFVKMQ